MLDHRNREESLPVSSELFGTHVVDDDKRNAGDEAAAHAARIARGRDNLLDDRTH